MPSTEVSAGITEGLANVMQYNRDRPLRDARLSEAQSRQQLSQAKLAEYSSNAGNRATERDMEMQQLQLQLRKSQSTQLQGSTFMSFDAYEADGDTRHLNNLLKSAKGNPVGTMWEKWNRFDPLVRNKETEAMLAGAGITDLDAYFSDPELVKSKIMAADKNGDQTMIDVNKLYQATGYTRYASARQVRTLMERANLEKLLKGPRTADSVMIEKIMADDPNLSTLDAIKQMYEAKNSGKVTGSSVERIAQDLRSKDPSLSLEESLQQAAKLQAAPGAAEKNVEFSEEVRARVHEAAGGDFYSADLTDPAIRNKVGEQMTALLQATKAELSTEDKRLARKYRALTSLGQTVGEEMTAEQTGLVDSMLHDFKQYFTSEVTGVEATASYNTFRNFARNALMGATLTPAEIKSYNQAAGTLGNKLGPVLAKFKVQMQDVQARFKAIYDMSDPMVAQWYLGSSLDHVDSVIEGIDERLALFEGSVEANNKAEVLSPLHTTPPNRSNMSASERWESLK